MTLLTPGRLVMKLAGRDAGRVGVVVEQLDAVYLLVDGNVRRKKVNVKHVEPLEKVIELKKGVSHEEVVKAFRKEGLPVWETKTKQPGARPRKQRKKVESVPQEGAKAKKSSQKSVSQKPEKKKE